MIDIRTSNAVSANSQVQRAQRVSGQSNIEWVSARAGEIDLTGAVVLLGGSSRTDVRLRFAQSQARRDLLPSYWSHAVLIVEHRTGRWPIAEVSLEPAKGFGDVPYHNAVQRGVLSAYDDPVKWPNIALLQLPPSASDATTTLPDVRSSLAAVERQRQLADIPTVLLEWLGFAWGAEGATNPLLKNRGIPSAVMIEAVYAVQGIELTPGLATTASCPEAIWQAAKWWHGFYSSPASRTAGPFTGWFSIGQEDAWVPQAVPKAMPPARRSRTRRR